MFEKIKTLLILTLLVLVVYQIIDLWYEQDGVINENAKYQLEMDSSEVFWNIDPIQIAVSLGDSNYTLINRKTMQEKLVFDYLNKIYTNLSKIKVELRLKDLTLDELYKRKSIIIKYQEPMNFDSLPELFDGKNERVLKQVGNINEIVIDLSDPTEKEEKIYLRNSEGLFFEFVLDVDLIELYGLIDDINMFNQCDLYMISKDYIFIPTLLRDNNSRMNFEFSNPFMTNGEFDEALAEKSINSFFSNPKAKWKMDKGEDIIIYGDGEKTIRLYKDGFIEYISYLAGKKVNLKGIIRSSKEFLAKNVKNVDNYYVSCVEKIDEDEYKIGYNLNVNGFNYIVSNEIRNKYKIDYPIEIIMKGNVAVSYRRVMIDVNFSDISLSEDDDEKKAFEIISYDEAKSIVDNEVGISNTSYDVNFGYYSEELHSIPKLMWIFKGEGLEKSVSSVRGTK